MCIYIYIFFSVLSNCTFLLCLGIEQLTPGCLSVTIYSAFPLPLMLHEKCIKNGCTLLCVASKARFCKIKSSAFIHSTATLHPKIQLDKWKQIHPPPLSTGVMFYLGENRIFRLLHCNHLSTSASSWKS